MIEDVVRQLGYLTLGTRLRRLGEQFQSHTQRILEGQGLTVPAGQLPALVALDRLGPLTVGEVAEALGVSQPGATRTLAQLDAAGLVAIKATAGDRRRKQVRLTAAGRRVVATGERTIWPVVEAAVREVCDGRSGPLLAQLDAIEDQLAAAPLAGRTAATRGGPVGGSRRRRGGRR